ncbi:polyprenyl synthetase family protein [Massilia aurea]|uniref:polyprenyl synthetase family protein n=1 Tax=Massilia aurea TaxID=373040 RepID=UPI003461A942
MSATYAAAPQDCGAAPHATPFDQTRRALEQRLMALLPNHGDPDNVLAAAMRHAVLGVGKRVRPMLFMSICRDLGHDAPALFDLACAIEVVHASSLILDDLPCMDDATLRRGQPAVHVQFGEDVALLAAVALLSHAFQIVASVDGISPGARMRLTGALAHAVGAQGLAKGQYQDLREVQQRPADDIAMTYALKTGSLLSVAVEMASIIAQTNPETTQWLRQFASTAGQAFQIRDDLLDAGMGPVLAKGEMIGKDIGQDAGKATLPAALGIEAARLRMVSEVSRADQYLEVALGPRNQTRRLLLELFPH